MKKIIYFETSKGKFAFVKLENMKISVKIEIPYIDYGLVKHLTEELWSEIVDSIKFKEDNIITESTASYTGQCLLESLGIENGTWVVIKYK